MQFARPSQSFFSGRLAIALGLLFVALFATAELSAGEKKEPKTPAAGSAVVSEVPPKVRMTDAARDKRKEETINTVYVLAGGIILMLVVLFTMILLGGSWARRLARTPLPSVKRPDELWYLKNPQDRKPDETSEPTAPAPPSDES